MASNQTKELWRSRIERLLATDMGVTLMDKRPGSIVRVSCLVHILRKFKDVLKGVKGPFDVTV